MILKINIFVSTIFVGVLSFVLSEAIAGSLLCSSSCLKFN